MRYAHCTMNSSAWKQPDGFDAQLAIAGVGWQKVAFYRAEHFVVNLAPQMVGVGVAELAVVAVERGQHALEDGGAGVDWWRELMQRQPLRPGTALRLRAMGVVGRIEQGIEKVDAAAQGPQGAFADITIVREDDVAEKIGTLIDALQDGFVGMKLQLQAVFQESVDLAHLFQQFFGFVAQDDEVIDVTQVAPDF